MVFSGLAFVDWLQFSNVDCVDCSKFSFTFVIGLRASNFILYIELYIFWKDLVYIVVFITLCHIFCLQKHPQVRLHFFCKRRELYMYLQHVVVTSRQKQSCTAGPCICWLWLCSGKDVPYWPGEMLLLHTFHYPLQVSLEPISVLHSNDVAISSSTLLRSKQTVV